MDVVIYRDSFAYWDNVDSNAHLCHSGVTGVEFGGFYAEGCIESVESNPFTGVEFCPSGFIDTVVYTDSSSCWNNVDSSACMRHE